MDSLGTYLKWYLNIYYQELEQFTEKTLLEFGFGIINPPLPITSLITLTLDIKHL